MLYIAGKDFNFERSEWQGRWDMRTVLDGTLARGRSIINVAFRYKTPTDFFVKLTFINISYAESRWEVVGHPHRIVLLRLLPRPNFHLMPPVSERETIVSSGVGDAEAEDDDDTVDGFLLV
jgi:hypothetical protein